MSKLPQALAFFRLDELLEPRALYKRTQLRPFEQQMDMMG